MDAALLREKSPLLKKFDLLPPVFRKPDYARAVIVSLLVLNLLALLGLAGIKQYRLSGIEQQLSHEISEIMPKVREIKLLRAQEKQLTEDIEKIQELSKSPDLITFLKKMNDELPKTSFLDQLRLDQNKNTIHIQGYTEDIGELTARLQVLGQTKLKSTSRRRNETYFQLEISLL
jgi:Tfp pilus assembly protein PilN